MLWHRLWLTRNIHRSHDVDDLEVHNTGNFDHFEKFSYFCEHSHDHKGYKCFCNANVHWLRGPEVCAVSTQAMDNTRVQLTGR